MRAMVQTGVRWPGGGATAPPARPPSRADRGRRPGARRRAQPPRPAPAQGPAACCPASACPTSPGWTSPGRSSPSVPQVTTVRPGDRVLVDPTVGCGACPACDERSTGLLPRLAEPSAASSARWVRRVRHRPGHRRAPGARPRRPRRAPPRCPPPGASAWHAVHRVGGRPPGEWVLVQAGASAVSVAAIQLARRPAPGCSPVAHYRGQAGRRRRPRRGRARPGRADRRARCGSAPAGTASTSSSTTSAPPPGPISLASLRTGGRLVLLGNTSGDQVSFSSPTSTRRGLRLLGAGRTARPTSSPCSTPSSPVGCGWCGAAEYPLGELTEAYARQGVR